MSNSSSSSSNSRGSNGTSRYTKERLYELIPAIYRQHDAKLGKPLEALIEIISEQVEVIENDIDTLYDNWFIETCKEWLVPYIGDLVGTKLLRSVEGARISNRAWVANTIRYRRGKGTAYVVEQLAKDVTNWDARVVEFFRLLVTTQNINHLRLGNIGTVDIRTTERLELLDTPFDTISHTADIRNIRSKKGYYNIPNLGVFLWRIKSYPVINAPALPHGRGRYSFSQLGRDMQLFNNPVPEGRGDGAGDWDDIQHIAEEVNVPSPIRRLALSKRLKDYYGREKSILIMTKSDNNDSAVTDVNQEVVRVCNLSDWNNRPSDKVAIDPVLGRIAFPDGEEPSEVYVNYYYGFSSDLGGGFYDREDVSDDLKLKLHLDLPKDILEDEEDHIINVSKEKPFSQALDDWEAGGRKSTIFEITDNSMFYTEGIAFTGDRTIPENTTLVIRSGDRQRAVLRAPFGSDSDLHMEIAGNSGSKLILEGLMFDRSMNIQIKSGDLNYLCINHCTLVPGENASLQLDSENDNSSNNNNLTAVIYRSICGKISIANTGARLMVVDSIVDGNSGGGGGGGGGGGSRSSSENDNPNNTSIDCYNLLIERSTIFGKVNVNLLELASNSIFTDVVTVKRRQDGCIRFSFIPTGSKTPRCYRCLPAPHLKGIVGSVELKPRFTSERYGDAGYAQLHKDSPAEIFEGADNEAEMGVFNNLYQPQRIRNLESSLDEYLRFGLEAGILLVDANEVGRL